MDLNARKSIMFVERFISRYFNVGNEERIFYILRYSLGLSLIALSSGVVFPLVG